MPSKSEWAKAVDARARAIHAKYSTCGGNPSAWEYGCARRMLRAEGWTPKNEEVA